jgi:uncharacterized protein
MSLYFDASAVLPMLVEEATTTAIDALTKNPPEPLLLSDFAAGEVASAIARLVRTRVLREDDAQNRLQVFDLWRAGNASDISTLASDIAQAALLVRRFALGLRMPDAIHLAICQRLGASLVTFDQRLYSAAAFLHVPIWRPLSEGNPRAR